MLSAPPAGGDFFPLDEELELLPGSLTPSLVESMVRLGTWMPFEPAAKMVGFFTKVEVREVMARRKTQEAGEAYVEVQTAEVEKLEKEMPQAPEGPPLQQLSVDGAYVPLVHKEWAEVKTLAIGTIGEPEWENGERVVHTKELSYFSRLADAESFTGLALVETHRRGVEKAGKVCAVVDGAEWEQKFIDVHRPDGERILDWGHGAGYVGKVGQALFGVGTVATAQWLGVQLHELKHGEPEKVLGKLRGLKEELLAQGNGGSEILETVSSSLEYLEKRREQIRYAEFQRLGYPIGSGIVESANKLVVEARMKGAGMHWAREHVNPMVALRDIVCSDRWEEGWAQISQRLRQKAKEGWVRRRAQCSGANGVSEEAALGATVGGGSPMEPPTVVRGEKGRNLQAEARDESKACSRRPAASHPWRHMPIGRARRAQTSSAASAEK